MKKIIIFNFTVLLTCIFFITNINPSAEELGELADIFEYQNYLGIDYDEYENKEYIGEYYKVGPWGHHMVANIGDISLKAYKVEDIYETTAVGTFSSIVITDTYSYEIIGEVSVEESIKIGILEILKAVFELDDSTTVGSETELSVDLGFLLNISYSVNLSETYTIESTVDLTNIPEDKKTFSLSRVAVFLETEVLSSYTEEQKWWLGTGYYWKILNDTISENYVVRYYIADLVTFCYNDMTFGNKVIGTYPLNVDIKEYE